MATRPPDDYYRDLDRRLGELLPLAEVALPPSAYRWYAEFVDVGEYGLAVETAVEALPSEGPASAESLRVGLTDVAETMGIALPGRSE